MGWIHQVIAWGRAAKRADGSHPLRRTAKDKRPAPETGLTTCYPNPQKTRTGLQVHLNGENDLTTFHAYLADRFAREEIAMFDHILITWKRIADI